MRYFLLLLLLCASCAPRHRNQDSYCIVGSEEFQTLLDLWSSDYQERLKLPPPLHEGRGNGTVVLSFREETCEIGARTRPLSDAELAEIQSGSKTGVIGIPVAAEALAIIVPAASRLTAIEFSSLSALYQNTERPKELEKTAIYGVNSASDRFRWFKETVLNDAPLSDTILETAGPLSLVDAVAGANDAIGYARPAELTDRVKVIPVIVHGKPRTPDERSIRTGEYPLSRYLYLYVSKKASPASIRFLSYILSTEGQKRLVPTGLYPLSETERKNGLATLHSLESDAR